MALRARRFASLFPLVCLALLLAPAPSAWAAKHKKPAKTWPKKSSSKSDKKAAPAADDADEDSGAKPAAQKGGDDDDDAPETKPDTKSDKAKAASKASKLKMDEDGDEKEARKSKDDDDDSGGDDEDGAPVVRKKARKPAAAQAQGDEGEAVPLALALEVGSRGVYRTFDFNDTRSYSPTTPGSYRLPGGPVPFLHFALYPLAFAGRGGLANLGLVGRYERLIGTSTVDKSLPGQPTSTTSGQEWDVGLRGRLPIGDGEVGLTGTYGQHSFLLSSADVPPGVATVPNVEYTFLRLDAEGAVPIGPITLGGHVGTRFVPKTGALGKWFGTTKTTSIEAGLSLAYRLTPMFEVVAGADLLRYAFAFSPPTNNGIIAGGAVDQYISGYLALRVSISGG
jgi:hypothetical protein